MLTVTETVTTVSAMKLSAWLEANPDKSPGFHARIEVTEYSLSRYASGKRIPKARPMVLIAVETDHQVMPNDFYDIPDRAAASSKKAAA